ncbi:MAG: LPS export ABC transporter permease LptG [Gammaproteobacteria bacterium]
MPDMNAFDKYIAMALLKGWLIVLTILLSVFGLLQFVQELEHVGQHYKTINAALFVLQTLPQLALDLMPVAGLLGTLLALAGLSRHSELIAIRAAGASNKRILLAVLLPGMALSIGILLLSEFVTANLYQYAEDQRAVVHAGSSTSTKNGKSLWSNSQGRFFHVGQLKHGHIPTNIQYYEFDEEGKLILAAHADYADLDQSRDWSLIDVVQKESSPTGLKTSHLDKLDMGPFWKRDELPALSLSTAAMPPTSLYKYAQHLRETNQRSDKIELAFWKKISLPLTTLAMIILATPMGAKITSQRNADFAQRMGIGALIGILFYLGSQIIHTSGAMIKMHPAILTLIPIGIILIASNIMFRKLT